MSFVSQLAILFMAASTLYDVIMRYIFAKPTIWAVELNAALIVIITFLAASRLTAEERHIGMDALYDRLPPAAQVVVGKVVQFIVMLFCLVLLWFSYRVMVTVYTSKIVAAGAFRLPMWIPYAAIVAGSALMVLEYAVHLFSRPNVNAANEAAATAGGEAR